MELGASSLRLRYEELLLADDANAEPAEQNAARSGLLAMQAAASALLMLHDTCPAEMEACGRECVAAAAGLAAATFGPSTGQLGAKCRQNPSAPACLLQLMAAMPADATALLVCLLPHARDERFALANPLGLFVQQFPVRARVELVNFRKYLYPMTFLPALLITMQGTLTLLGEEKEKGIKDAMSLKGMSRAAYWISWLVSQGLGMTISCFVVAVAARALGIIEHTGMVHFGVMLWLYGCWLVTFAFLISACLKTIKAMFVVALILLIVIGPIVYVVEFLFIRLDVSYIFILGTFMPMRFWTFGISIVLEIEMQCSMSF